MLCSEVKCRRKAIARGLCGKHYQYKKLHGELQNLLPSQLNQGKRNGQVYQCSACQVEFYRRPCDLAKASSSERFCSRACWYRRNADLKCIAAECGLPQKKLRYCLKHYRRVLRHGDPLITKRAANGSPDIKRYRRKKVDGRTIHEHAYVAEQILGRRLTPGENVHHRDGEKLNNRPDNLILFPTMSAHRQYENRYREYLERCIREGYLVWVKDPPPFEHHGVLLSEVRTNEDPKDN